MALELSVDVTNSCNLECAHCLRDKLEFRSHLLFGLFKKILDEAHELGIRYISLTGGEPTLHPEWEKFLFALAEKGFRFSIVTNGWRFKEKTLPTLLVPTVRSHVESICFSLDGASAKSHDTIRGKGSFQEVIKAMSLCRLKGLPMSIKTVVTNFNKCELTEIAMLCSSFGVTQLSFIALTPTLRALKEGIVPSLKETKEIFSFITGRLIPSMNIRIVLEGSWGVDSYLFACNAYQQAYSVDHLGNLLFCCNLSHVFMGDNPYIMGEEFLADLKKESLKEGIARHYQLLAKFTKNRLDALTTESPLRSFACWWCLKYFGKLGWIENYQNFPLVREMFLS